MITCRCLYYLKIPKWCSYLVESITYQLHQYWIMELCYQTHDLKPDPFFMVDCYRYHDKYVITKNEEWFGFSEVDVQKVMDEF